MKIFEKTLFIFKIQILAGLLLFCGCAHHQRLPEETFHTAYAVHDGQETQFLQHAPVFLVYNYPADYNRIGRPSAGYDDQGQEQIYVDSHYPVVYFQKQSFATPKGHYTNLVYRVHFPETPFRLIPFYLTYGKNVGLMVVITLDSRQKPVLVTTVHTCGCYLSIVPTTFLPRESLPLNWQQTPLEVYGEKLPWQLDYAKPENPKLLVHLRPGVHRVIDLKIIDERELQDPSRFTLINALLAPVRELEKIPLGDGFTSFYYQAGPLKGHVKGSVKLFESLLMSLPSLDFFVGTDKAYADQKETGNPFYTSLKPWNRSASNMWNFAEFLAFWGWRL